LDSLTSSQLFLLSLVIAPGAAAALLGLAWLLGWSPRERPVAVLSIATYFAATLATLALGVMMIAGGLTSVSVARGNWFHVHHYEFPLVITADRLSWPMMFLTTLLTGLVSLFSARYMHRDPGFFRFFFLLNLFGFGCLLVFAAGALDLLVAGWELVGLTSVLLIGYFHTRPEPVRGAIHVFTVYRLCDVGLLVGVAALHLLAGSATFERLFDGEWPAQATPLPVGPATIVGLLLLLAACGKSAQIPFSGWLPRAMEGPTPSSAIFYGAISVHIGAYLLLRAAPILEASPVASIAAGIIGALTAIHGTLASRVAADAKTALAFASLTQVGLVFVEISLGWYSLALLHIIGHSLLRALQFLRAPSLLHEHHQMHAAAAGDLGVTGRHYERLLSPGFRAWLYRLAVDRSHLDALLDRLVAEPALRIARKMSGF
jgi:NADH:ubiquinone oxidoreductase subunit 5 (subunit L)/multisubunit Na+/H+ antiporter MnhA subunit